MIATHGAHVLWRTIRRDRAVTPMLYYGAAATEYYGVRSTVTAAGPSHGLGISRNPGGTGHPLATGRYGVHTPYSSLHWQVQGSPEREGYNLWHNHSVSSAILMAPVLRCSVLILVPGHLS